MAATRDRRGSYVPSPPCFLTSPPRLSTPLSREWGMQVQVEEGAELELLLSTVWESPQVPTSGT